MRIFTAILLTACLGASAAAAPRTELPHSSQKKACEALAEEIAFELSLLTSLDSPSVFLVGDADPGTPEPAMESALERLKTALFEKGFRPSIADPVLFADQIRPRLEVEGAEGTEKRLSAAAFALTLEVTETAGRMQIRGILPELNPRVASYVHKGWVSQTSEELATRAPGKGHAIVGRSRLEGNEADARRAAVARAGEELREVVIDAARSGHSRWLDWGGLDRLREHVAAVLPDAIIEKSYVQDSYIETVEKPYGNVHRAHVLLVVDGPTFEKAAWRISSLSTRDRNVSLLRLVAAVLVGPVIFLIYLVSDWVTRGYLTWPLRGIGVIAFASAIWLLIQSGRFF